MKKEAYYTTKIQNELVFQYCGYEKCTPDFIHHPHMRSEYLIHYIQKGSGQYNCEGQIHELKQGDLFLITPDTLVSYSTDSTDPFVFSWFAFSGSRAGETMTRLGFSDTVLVRKLHSRYAITEPVEMLVSLINSPVPFDDFSILELLYRILALLTASYRLSSPYTTDGNAVIQDHIDRAKSYIKFNYMNDITVKSVSDYVGLERSYFSKIFHRYTGRTTQKYILEVRIHHSRQLLETTNFSIVQIASYIGIGDAYYFSRAFRQIVGSPPSQYRKQFISRHEGN